MLRRALVLSAFLFVSLFASTHILAAPRDVQFRSVDFETGVVELFNFGDTDQPLDDWQLCTHDDDQIRLYGNPVGLEGVVIAAGSSFFIHFNDDAPGDGDDINLSVLGPHATPLDRGPYSLSIYFAPGRPLDLLVDFDDGNLIADHLQWNIGGADDDTADERSDEAEAGGVWTDQTQWIATAAETARIELTDTTGGVLHGPDDYRVTDGGPTGDPRTVQFRSVDFETGVVELFNFSDTDQPLDDWQLCTHDDDQIRLYGNPVGLEGVAIAAGSSFFIHFNDDAPGDGDDINLSVLGPHATPLDRGPYSLSIYFAPGRPLDLLDFEDGNLIADHLQWNIGGADDDTADERSDEAEAGGVWTDQTQWIATTAETARIELTDTTGGVLHGPADYTAVEPGGAIFRRGDTDGNGQLEVTDPINSLSFQFLGSFTPPCKDAADFDDNGKIELTDPIANLSHQFLGTAPPVAPGKETCGPDPTDDDGNGNGTPGEPGDDLGCEQYPADGAPPAAECEGG